VAGSRGRQCDRVGEVVGAISVCDGTGEPLKDGTPVTGLLGKQYCDEARVIAEQYLADLNALHTESAITFMNRLTSLRAIYHEKLRKLPDEL
jgi:hypothetical protein